jgi:hypothetical protein
VLKLVQDVGPEPATPSCAGPVVFDRDARGNRLHRTIDGRSEDRPQPRPIQGRPGIAGAAAED